MAKELLKGLYSYFFEKEEEIPLYPLTLEMEKSAADMYIVKEDGKPVHVYSDKQYTHLYALKPKFLKDIASIAKSHGYKLFTTRNRDGGSYINVILTKQDGRRIIWSASGDMTIYIKQFHTSKVAREVRRRNRERNNNNNNNNDFDDWFDPEVHELAEEYDGLPFLSVELHQFEELEKDERKAALKLARLILRRLSHTDTELLEKTKKQLEALEAARPNISEDVSRRVLSEFLLGYKADKENAFFAKGLAPNTRKRARNVKNLLEERIVKAKRGGTRHTRRTRRA